MRGSDWTLVYCNQWNWGSVVPLAEAVEYCRGAANNLGWNIKEDTDDLMKQAWCSYLGYGTNENNGTVHDVWFISYFEYFTFNITCLSAVCLSYSGFGRLSRVPPLHSGIWVGSQSCEWTSCLNTEQLTRCSLLLFTFSEAETSSHRYEDRPRASVSAAPL